MSDESTQENYAGVWDTGLGFGKKSALIVIDLLQGYTTEGSDLYAPVLSSASLKCLTYWNWLDPKTCQSFTQGFYIHNRICKMAVYG